MPPFRQRLRAQRVVPRRREQLAFQRRIVELFGHRPGDADHSGAANVFTDRGAADPERSPARSPHRRTSTVKLLEPSASTISRRASDLQLRKSQKEDLAQLRSPTRLPASPYQQGWPLSIGLGGRFPSESVAAFPRNPHPPLEHANSIMSKPTESEIIAEVEKLRTLGKDDLRVRWSTLFGKAPPP
jgi:hypothetical protein